MPKGIDALEGLQWTQNAAYQEQSGDWVGDKRHALTQIEKKGMFGRTKENSSGFQAIVDALNRIDSVLGYEVSEDNEVWQTSLRMVFKGYQTLMEACDRYLTDSKGNMRSAFTDHGKRRIQAVAEIKSLAEQDMQCLMVQRFENPANIQERTVRGMLQKARTRVIEMKGTDKDHDHVGGNASTLTVLSEEETGGAAGFFGIEKIINKEDLREQQDQMCLLAAKRTGLDDEKFKQVRAVLGYSDINTATYKVDAARGNWIAKLAKSELVKDPEINDFLTCLKQLADGHKTTYENLFQDNLANVTSGLVNLGNHNVATSRVAEMLGIGNVVAKSEKVELREQGQSSGTVGNLMEKAHGTEGTSLLITLLADHFADNVTQVSTNAKLQQTVEDFMKSKATASFQKDMTDLQVLDYLCGQIDRHHGNYFIQTNAAGEFTGVQGIDNDLSFGDAQRKKGRNMIGSFGKMVVSDDGELYIPYMSKELAMSINSLDESMFRYALKDLLEEVDLDAFCTRLVKLQKAIKKELVKNPADSRLRAADQWGDDTWDAMLSADAAYSSARKGTSNYMGTFVDFAFDSAKIGPRAKALVAKKKENA